MTQLAIPVRVVGLAALVSLTLIASGLPGCVRFNSAADSYQIGHVAPRSGPDRAEGVRLSEAIAQVVEEFNHDEPRSIDQRLVTVVNGDSGPDLDGFTYQATRLLTINRVAALIGGTNVIQLEKLVSPIQAAQGSPGVQGLLVSPSGASPSLRGKSIWPIGIHPADRGKYLAKFAAESLKLAEIAVIVDHSHSLYAAMGDAFKVEFQHPDRRIKADWSFKDSAELAAQAAKIATAEPGAILFCGRAVDLLTLVANVRDHSKTRAIPILFAGEEEQPVLLNDASRSQGIVYTTAFAAEDMAERVQKFCTDFRSRVGQLPDASTAMSADAIRLLLAAGKKAQSLKKDAVVNELAKLDSESITGPFWFDKDQVAHRTIYVMRIEGGTAKLQKTYAPEKK